MASASVSSEFIAIKTAEERAEELLRARLDLMYELEASLEGSRKALVALDLAQIESGTSDQARLIPEFDALLERCRSSRAADRAMERPAEPATPQLGTYPRELKEKLCGSQNRILDALRLQSALLARAQGKLRVLGNMLADPTVPYGPLLARASGRARFAWKCEEKSDSCRA